jgi:hypothetical protein
MFLVRGNGPAIARIPKNASQSIAMAMMPFQSITNEEALLRDLRVMFIRDPYERLASCYSFFSWLRTIGTQVIPPLGDWTDYPSFIDWALDSPDAHVAPQYDQVITADGTFVPNRIHLLKDIKDQWDQYYPGLIPDMNDFPVRHKCSKLAVTNYRRQDIAVRYAKDLELCRAF